ncbi:hypothetical protein PSECIP111951_02443 [Pseudoalteromonas holothuriae]|uniref:Uncharacterized protein n=1 Tax=Pseudoalteromonas holothuriae TaxID=2963714 RepID=A0A9W4VT37_9GAMM|nr:MULTISPECIES: hypothetical protein [unclassified Pseudoalteromonas]CAH9053591.1 hypothetical protein PSECIP111854_01200 [Pseudoalteromonas sp. CIP111854]CAH9061229.1 hypothetical protein PSECIP111951_02443 [Pseudoalteromonas sp. CIP111951]
MKQLTIFLISLAISTLSYANDLTTYMDSLDQREITTSHLDDNGHFNVLCRYSCNIDQEFRYIFSFYDTYFGKEQVFNFFDGSELVESITLEEYLDIYYPTVPRIVSNDVQPLDMPLDCRYDPDYSCEQWVQSDFLDYVINKKVEFTVTQEFIDGNNDARRIAISVVTANAVGKIAARVAAALSVIIRSSLVEATTATAINEILTGTNWYRTDLQAGDTLVIKGGSLLEVRSGSSSGGGSEGGGGRDRGRDVERGFICVTVWTNSGGGDVAQQVCY